MRGWSIDEIRKMNPGGARSQVDALIEMAAASEDYLEEISDILDECPEPSILASFQLPTQLLLDREPYQVPGLGEQVRFFFRSRNHRVICDQLGRVRLASEAAPEEFAAEPKAYKTWSAPVTSIVVTSPLWGSRAEFYSRYEALLSPNGPRDGIVVPEHLSWDRHMAMNPARFEANMIRRAQTELFYGIRIFLKAVRLQTLRKAWTDEDICGLFWMTYPGVLRRQDLPRPIISSILTSYSINSNPIVCDDLTGSIKRRHREESEFERGLLEAERLRSKGEAAAGFLEAFILMEGLVTQEAMPHLTPKRLERIQAGQAHLMAGEAIKILLQLPEPWPNAAFDLDQMEKLRVTRNSLAHQVSRRHSGLDTKASECISLARRMFRNRNLSS